MGELHNLRIQKVIGILKDADVTTVLDLGCGEGHLLSVLARDEKYSKLIGIDIAGDAISIAREEVATHFPKVSVFKGSFLEHDSAFTGVEAIVMLETIEHIPPQELSRLEGVVFNRYQPKVVVITTPNADYNAVFGMSSRDKRRDDHEFEWTRVKFKRWATGVAARNGYEIEVDGIGPVHSSYGTPSQFAFFRLSN